MGYFYKWESSARFLIEWKFDRKLEISTYWNAIKDKIPNNEWQWLWTGGIKHGLFRHGHCYRGSIEALKELSGDHEIVIITKRPKAAREDTLAWLAFHQIPTDEVHIIGPGGLKSHIECDLYVDDSEEVNAELTMAGLTCILWKRPWNSPDPRYHCLVSSWEEVIEIVRVVGEYDKKRAARVAHPA